MSIESLHRPVMIPNDDRRIRRARDQDRIRIPQTEHTPIMSIKRLETSLAFQIPQLDRSISAAGHQDVLMEL
ncbi:hypothetical protein RO3G_04490 [Rhizopus delemar RA 99-880]|uniref:Uncharacterized protein n=1 Tax=Rhizopus delemar (strain RA 99-880 / ATCC MYA-4621 / FGSC 9543 / NRRL 43880) TaxID=246409 RepID=I1BUA5_RHIO9|nr:hypothetical protein RO3G_04490 [Rhizopus delemar RA 99-880]|eukprot:EIE79785.1 hypothetical protein RO3G_04490 [Rhizopus delemar RA 99-880]